MIACLTWRKVFGQGSPGGAVVDDVGRPAHGKGGPLAVQWFQGAVGQGLDDVGGQNVGIAAQGLRHRLWLLSVHMRFYLMMWVGECRSCCSVQPENLTVHASQFSGALENPFFDHDDDSLHQPWYHTTS